jgi:hypothetical protein
MSSSKYFMHILEEKILTIVRNYSEMRKELENMSNNF